MGKNALSKRLSLNRKRRQPLPHQLFSNKAKAVFFTILAGALWGTSFPIIKIGLKTIDPFAFVFWRFFVSCVALLAVMLLFKRLEFKAPNKKLNPQGTLAERVACRRRRHSRVLTPTGYGTMVAKGKETRDFGGRHYVLERALRGDFAFIKAWKGDWWGNLVFHKTARNFNPMMATAADYVIAEVEQLVEPGNLSPIRFTPPVFLLTRFFKVPTMKRIEQTHHTEWLISFVTPRRSLFSLSTFRVKLSLVS